VHSRLKVNRGKHSASKLGKIDHRFWPAVRRRQP
jgi:hypothetical protein